MIAGGTQAGFTLYQFPSDWVRFDATLQNAGDFGIIARLSKGGGLRDTSE